MREFDFSTNAMNLVIKELQNARRYIRLAVFQIHNPILFEILNAKLDEGVDVEILTLPYDSINKEIEEEVTNKFRIIGDKGAKIHFCRWNIGDPGNTKTAVNKWYSFHGKFIVTDNSAIALSANFTKNEELDAVIIFQGESDKIKEFNDQFDRLLELFVHEKSGYNGSIRERIISTNVSSVLRLFELPKNIGEMYKNHWIQDYPSVLCPVNNTIQDKLYIAPFDARARDFLMSVISKADQFVYISTESFTDADFAAFLIKKHLDAIDMRVLTGARSRDFQEYFENMLRELLSQEILVSTPVHDTHAKMLLTEKHLVVGSVNLNQINLGISKTSTKWRSNTETIMVCSDPQVIELAKKQFLSVFEGASNIEEMLVKKIEKVVGSIFTATFGLRSKQEVKTLFARLVLKKEVEIKRLILKVGATTAYLMKISKRNMVEKNDFFSAVILYYLTERKHSSDQLVETLTDLDPQVDLTVLLNQLLKLGLIEKTDEGYYKIKIDTLLKRDE